MKYKIMTKDRNWTIKENLTEKQAEKFWNQHYIGNTGHLDHVAVDENDKGYVLTSEGFIEENSF